MTTEGVKRLSEWLGENAKAIEVTAQQRDADSQMVDRALEIVRKFIVDRNLILFGGLAIDYALRLKGSRLYPDDERPDFDFLSPRSVDDAYDLADLLRSQGFESVGAVRAIHVQTMRVGTDFIWVADIGYSPPEVFDKIPTLEWKGMRFAHPDYQRMDQHLAFCFPFNGAPREDVFNRWRKDLKRFNLYADNYPIVATASSLPILKTIVAKSGLPVVGAPDSLKVALHGFAAYAYMRKALDELSASVVKLIGGDVPEVKAPRLSLKFPDEYSIEVEVPAGDVVVVASYDPAETAGKDAESAETNVEWFEPYMDLTPVTARSGSLLVYSTQGRLLSTSVGRVELVKTKGAKSPKTSSSIIVTPQYLLLHFLFESHHANDDAARAIYRDYYCHVLEILNAAERLFAALIGAGRAEAEIAELWDASPFSPTVRTLGDVNHDAAYIVRMAGYVKRVGRPPPPSLHLPAKIDNYLRDLPQNYYPDGKKARPKVDYTANSLFRRAGHPIKKDELLV